MDSLTLKFCHRDHANLEKGWPKARAIVNRCSQGRWWNQNYFSVYHDSTCNFIVIDNLKNPELLNLKIQRVTKIHENVPKCITVETYYLRAFQPPKHTTNISIRKLLNYTSYFMVPSIIRPKNLVDFKHLCDKNYSRFIL